MSFFHRITRNLSKTAAVMGSSCFGIISAASMVSAQGNTPSVSMPSSCVYSLQEVSQHNSTETGVWVAFKDGVYDVTHFIPKHPGGPEYIQLAAGGRLEPFWGMFNLHLKGEAVQSLLETYRVGTLQEKDQVNIQPYLPQFDAATVAEPFEQRPYDKLIVMRNFPFLSEPKNELLADQYFTPNNLFYTRNHFSVPSDLTAENYKLDLFLRNDTHLKFTDMNDQWDDVHCDMSLTLDDIKSKFAQIEIVSTLQCSGNRGIGLREAAGLNHSLCHNGFISNAKWKGVRIGDVLKYAGYDAADEKYRKYKYVTFYGYDSDLSTMHYAVSAPLGHVMNEQNDCLLAFEMNGKELPKDHGYPLRVLLPGIAACRSVKWVAKMQLTEDEVDSSWQNARYAPFNHKIYDMPVTSVIARPVDGQRIDVGEDGMVNIKGFAWSGGGRGIIRVELSYDDGKTWNVCELQQCAQERGREWAWTLWEGWVDATEIKAAMDAKGCVKLTCRAWDSAFNLQPRDVSDVVNGTMYVNNSWHSITAQV